MNDPFDNPARNQAVLSNLVSNFRLIGLMPALQDMTFDQVVELWWYAQAQKAEAMERHQRRLNDLNDLYGKSAEYVKEFFAKRREETP